MKNTLTLILLTFLCLSTLAQRETVAVGTWQFHSPLHLSENVVKAKNKVYCATAIGLYYYDTDDQSINPINKQDGLSEIEISEIAYSEALDMLLIAYKNSNIDIIQGNTIININDIFRKEIVGEKTINHIYFYQDFAFLSCSFGVVKLDLKKLEIKESYVNLDSTGTSLNVYSSCVFNDSLVISTTQGIKAGRVDHPNLLDFNNWITHDTIQNFVPGDYTSMFAYKTNIYAYNSNKDSTYAYNGTVWQAVPGMPKNIAVFNGDENYFYAINADTILKTDFTTPNHITASGSFSKDLDVDGNRLWIADNSTGLYQYNNNVFTQIKPGGPSAQQIFSLSYADDKVYIMRGGYKSNYGRLQQALIVDILEDWGWNILGYWEDDLLKGKTDIVDVVYNPNNGKTYLASHGFGLIIKDQDGGYTLFNEDNSPLKSVIPGDSSFIRVIDLYLDEETDEVWVATHGAPAGMPGLFKINSQDEWVESIEFSGFNNSNFLEKVVLDKQNFVWCKMALNAGGVIVYNPEDGVSGARYLTSGYEKGNLPDNRVNDIAVDRDGEVWVGTDNGVAIYATPEFIFEGGEENDAFTPIFDGRPLLESEVVTAIEVDGGNRKWIGTNKGLWLFEDDGTEVVHQFTEDNSPLPSNKINAISIHEKTGEVFIGTDLGLVSYRSDATAGKGSCDEDYHVFPNPVQPGYDGLIGISGLSEDASIKITDGSGNLMFKKDGEGGMVSWDLKDYNGNRANTGVYNILVNRTSKKNSCVVKLVVIN